MDLWLSNDAQKWLDKMNTQTVLRIYDGLKKLMQVPPKGDIVKIKGSNNLYRLRIGKYRIIFCIENDIIKVTDIDSRGQIYK